MLWDENSENSPDHPKPLQTNSPNCLGDSADLGEPVQTNPDQAPFGHKSVTKCPCCGAIIKVEFE